MCYSKLKVRTSIYTSKKGENRLLIKIYGAMKFSEHGNAYIEIWVPFEYPQVPPIIYIKGLPPASQTQPQTTTSLLYPNNYIDPSGQFYHPFLSNWRKQFGSDTSNDNIKPRDNRLLRLTQTIESCLKKHPPVLRNDESNTLGRSIPPIPKKPVNIGGITNKLSKIKLTQPQTPVIPKSKPPAVAPLLPANPTNSRMADNIEKTINGKTRQDLFHELPLQEVSDIQNRLLKATESGLNVDNYLTYYEKKVANQSHILNKKVKQMEDLHRQLDHNLKDVLPHFDECLIAQTPVFNQIYTLVTEIEAQDDLLYHLGKLHESGKISFQRYLAAVRQLARKQCLNKQHVSKLSNICRLDT